MEEALTVLAGRVSSLDAVLLFLAWGIVKVMTAAKEVRVANARLAMKLLASFGFGAFALRLLFFLADLGYL